MFAKYPEVTHSYQEDVYGDGYAWLGHVPFAHYLVKRLRPCIFVELGTHAGVSYFAFCHAVQELNIACRCFAVDTWQGDPQAGFYGEDIWQYVTSYNQNHFLKFSALKREKFDDALGGFENGSIDLLHIDGFHSYEAVRHDFETWRKKLSPRGVVLFHDVAARQPGYGAWQYWEELKQAFPYNFEFQHSWGLGVLWMGDGQSPFDWEADEAESVRTFFSGLGDHVERYWGMRRNLTGQIERLRVAFDLANQRAEDERAQKEHVQALMAFYKRSWWYKVSKPLRKLENSWNAWRRSAQAATTENEPIEQKR